MVIIDQLPNIFKQAKSKSSNQSPVDLQEVGRYHQKLSLVHWISHSIQVSMKPNGQ